MSAKFFILFFIVFAGFTSCQNNSHETTSASDSSQNINPRNRRMPSTGGSENAKAEQLNMLIAESKKTLDSIDAAYKNIATERSNRSMSIYEREQVNEALMELNDAKDLIILETQEAVIAELKEKTSSLKLVMQKMNTASSKMQNIARSLSKISGIIEQTTNILASALTYGIIRPRIVAATTTATVTKS